MNRPRHAARRARPRGRLRVSLALLLALAVPATVRAQLAPPLRINEPGFGDRQNSYAWSMIWFRNQLYVGCSRNFRCLELYTIDLFRPGYNLYRTEPDPCITCTPDFFDLDLQAEIWRFDPLSRVFVRVYKSPADIPNPIAPGKVVARDVGFRNLFTFVERDGTEALYAAGTSAGEVIPGLPPPRLLRSEDGLTFEPVPIHLTPDVPRIMGFRSAVSYNGRLYLLATVSLLGNGVVLESSDPRTGEFRLVTPPTLNVYELAVFNNQLYLGLADEDLGYSVVKTDATGELPYALRPIVQFGAGRGAYVKSVVGMHVYNGRLYVGANGWGLPALFPNAELIRIRPDDGWDLVVGAPRRDPLRGFWRFPLSGLPDGFGNFWTYHIWRLQEHNGMLFAGTNDGSWATREYTADIPWIAREYGFDVYVSRTGLDWTRLTRNGFGTPSAFGLRTFASTPLGLFAGTANHCLGAEIWLSPDFAAPVAASRQLAAASTAGTMQLYAEVHEGAALLAWDAVPDARYRVYRALPQLQPSLAPRGPDGRRNGPAPIAPGPFLVVATTARPVLRDPAGSGPHAPIYHVEALDAAGRVVATSNLTAAFPGAPAPGLSDLDAALADLPRTAAPWRELAASARAAWARGDLDRTQGALAALRQRAGGPRGRGIDPLAAEDVDRLAARLLRRIDLVRDGALRRSRLDAAP